MRYTSLPLQTAAPSCHLPHNATTPIQHHGLTTLQGHFQWQPCASHGTQFCLKAKLNHITAHQHLQGWCAE